MIDATKGSVQKSWSLNGQQVATAFDNLYFGENDILLLPYHYSDHGYISAFNMGTSENIFSLQFKNGEATEVVIKGSNFYAGINHIKKTGFIRGGWPDGTY